VRRLFKIFGKPTNTRDEEVEITLLREQNPHAKSDEFSRLAIYLRTTRGMYRSLAKRENRS
jgi:hypothetical protein